MGAINLNLRLVREHFSLDVDLRIPEKGITAISGESGSGKTTLLRCIAGLEKASVGELLVGDEIWQDSSLFLPAHKRPIAYVFQEASLFPHLTARGNLQFAIKRSRSSITDAAFQRIIQIMGIEHLLDQYPEYLSGGERQRVAIARALLIQPQLVLMDEPLASLDAKRKQEILPYLEKLHETFDTPVIYVSHSAEEISRLADHLVVLEQGKVLAQGELQEIYSRLDLPLAVEDEAAVVLEGEVVEVDVEWHLVKVLLGEHELWINNRDKSVGEQVRIRIMAKDVSLAQSNNDDMSILNRLPVEITDVSENKNNAAALLRLKLGENYLLARITRKSVSSLSLREGVNVWAQIKAVAIVR